MLSIDREELLKQFDVSSLNDLLNQLEIDLSHLGQSNPGQAYQMLLRMDAASQKISSMRAAKNQVAAENAQFEYLVNSIAKNCQLLLRDLGGRNQLAKLRETNAPAAENSWWFPDQTIDFRTQKRVRKFVITFAICIVLAGVMLVVYDRFLKPDPVVLARYNAETDANQALASNDLPAALTAINQALQLGGDTSSLLIFRGAVETLMGQKDNAVNDFNVAEKNFADRSLFLISRAENWIKVGQADFALQDASEAIQLDPSSAQAFFYYGKANELKQNYKFALDAYQKASDLAEQQGKPELNATIRVTMAMLMQMPSVQFPTEAQTPTPR